MPSPDRYVGVKLSDGLGNQLYQYAVGLGLAKRLGVELRCDSSSFTSRKIRREGLHEFGLTWTESERPRRMRWRKAARKIGIPDLPFLGGPRWLADPGSVEPKFWTIGAPCYLTGYFQSFRYFDNVIPEVRAAFDVEKLDNSRIGEMEARIRAAEHPVMLHVRRTDYVKSAEAMARNAYLGLDYYQRARAVIEAKIPNPTYFLFSDDIPLAASELAAFPDLVPVAGFSTHEDFRLMASCRHFITANSTFSWWAAWLGKAPDKIVVAPKIWFGPASKWPAMMDDRIPPDWIQV